MSKRFKVTRKTRNPSWSIPKLSFPGIQVTLDSMPDNGVILVFTDTGSHQLHLEKSIREKMEKKNVKIFFALYLDTSYPYHDPTSVEVYKRLSKGQIFHASSDGTLGLDSEKFFKAVVHTVRINFNQPICL